jgi:tetratricopeptide (TPR) repeat protein
MAHDVFISYVIGDKQTADLICSKLESENLRCWIAPRDIHPGVKWATAILDSIASSRVLVLVFSEEANRSDHVEREVAEAFDNKTVVIALRTKNNQPTGTLKYYLRNVQWLDAFTPPLERHLEALAVLVKGLVVKKRSGRKPPKSFDVSVSGVLIPDREFYMKLGLGSWRSGDDEKAIKNYTEAIRLGPNFADAYYNRGNAYRRRGENDKAISDYTEAIRLDPNFANAYYNRGSAYRKKDDSRNAIIDYTEAIRLDPNYAKAFFNRGNIYLENRDYAKAINDYTEAIHLDSNSASAFFNRGNAYHERGDDQKAIDDYTEAIRLDPNSASAFFNRGITYRSQGKNDMADADLAKARQLKAAHT